MYDKQVVPSIAIQTIYTHFIITSNTYHAYLMCKRSKECAENMSIYLLVRLILIKRSEL